jgi:Cu(I)/Ag(I) efflux system membrane protein CusA/SilA
VGRADTATDPAPLSMAETTVRLLPRSQWPKLARTRWYSGWAPRPLRRALGLLWPEETPPTQAELVESLDRAARLPGWSGGWTAPIRARMDMMATGVRTPLGIRIVAADAERLDALGAAVRAVVEDVADTRSAVVESLGGETRLEFFTDAQALARHGVDAGAVQEVAHLVLTGGQIGDLEQAGRRLRVRIVPEQSLRGVSDQVREVTVRGSRNRAGDDHPAPPVALGLLGRPQAVNRPATIRSEQGELSAYVHVDVAPGTDLRGYVQRAQAALDGDAAARDLALAPGERIEWTGQYRLLAAGQRRLVWIVPAVVLSMLALLFLQFRSLTEALIVLASVPFALVGSVWTLFALGYQLSAPVWVGLLSVVGLAMQTGVVMVVYIDEAFHRRVREGKLASRDDIVAAHAEGTVQRLRPKLMTVTTMAAGLLPLLWADGPGAEIARRVAAPMIGGLASSAFLTLEVLPVLYTIWRHRQLRRAVRLGVPLQAVIGRIPPWAR